METQPIPSLAEATTDLLLAIQDLKFGQIYLDKTIFLPNGQPGAFHAGEFKCDNLTSKQKQDVGYNETPERLHPKTLLTDYYHYWRNASPWRYEGDPSVNSLRMGEQPSQKLRETILGAAFNANASLIGEAVPGERPHSTNLRVSHRYLGIMRQKARETGEYKRVNESLRDHQVSIVNYMNCETLFIAAALNETGHVELIRPLLDYNQKTKKQMKRRL